MPQRICQPRSYRSVFFFSLCRFVKFVSRYGGVLSQFVNFNCPGKSRSIRAGLNEDDYLFSSRFYFFVQFNLHLVGGKVNIHAGVVKRVKFDEKSFWTFFVRFLHSIWGVCRTRCGVSHETESNHANLCFVVDCFRGEIHQSRETGPLERLQPDGP